MAQTAFPTATHTALVIQQPRRTVRASSGSGGCGGTFGCFAIILGAGVVLYLIMRGRGDRQQLSGASHRPMGSGPLQPVTFACPYTKCPTCGGATDKMKQSWDGMRKVTWSCGYCASVAGVQELKDEELPASARQRLGLDQPQAPAPGMQGYGPGYGQPGGGGIGGLLTGMMIGSMMGGNHHHHDGPRQDGEGTWTDGSSSTNSDWGSGDSNTSDWGGGDSGSSSDSGGDWGGGDSGGGDSGGSDW